MSAPRAFRADPRHRRWQEVTDRDARVLAWQADKATTLKRILVPEMSHQAIAQRLGISQQSVRVTENRALSKMTKTLGPEWIEELRRFANCL